MILAKKRWGQHFLVNAGIILKIAQQVKRLSERYATSTVLEIGPGPGALTRALLEQGLNVVAVEIDLEMVTHLEKTFPEALKTEQLKIVSADFLDLETSVLDLQNIKVFCGNLPYNVGTPMVFRALECFPEAQAFCFMLQKEVVSRFIADVDDEDYGIPSVKLAWCCDVLDHFDVKPGSFRPPPKVESAVFSFVRKQTSLKGADPLLRGGIYDRASRLVEKCFQRRRQMLRRTLENAPASVASLRPENISPLGWLELLTLCIFFFGMLVGPARLVAAPLEDFSLGSLREGSQDTVFPFSEGAPEDLKSIVSFPGLSFSGPQSNWDLHVLEAKVRGLSSSENSHLYLLSGAKMWQKNNWSWGLMGALPFRNQSVPVFHIPSLNSKESPWVRRAENLTSYAFLQWRPDESKWAGGLSLACGIHADSSATFDFSADPSHSSLDVLMKPSCSWGVGVEYQHLSHRIEGAYQDLRAQKTTVNVGTTVALGTLLEPHLELKSDVTSAFSPRRILLSWSENLGEIWGTWGLAINWSQWSLMPAPIFQLTDSSPALTLAKLKTEVRDTWGLGLGRSVSWKKYSWFTSYRYEVSPFSTGRMPLYVDASRHIVGSSIVWNEESYAQNFGGQVHILEEGKGFYFLLSTGIKY